MYSVEVNGKASFKSQFTLKDGAIEGSVNDGSLKGDYVKINEHQFHFIIDRKSYLVDLLKFNKEEKSLLVKINTERFELKLKDQYDELLHNLGLDELNTKKVNNINAPMPGMVLNILVKEGETVKKGDAILVLEAMKMENILKAPSDGLIKKIAVIKGTAVEKNQLLIQF